MAQTPATGLTNLLLGKLFSEIDEKIKKLKGVRFQSESLRRDLNMLVAYKTDELANSRDARRRAVERVSGEQIRELIHDMDDCIERFLHRYICKKAGRFHRAVHTVKTIGIRNKFAKDMEELNKRLERLRTSIQSPATAEPSAEPQHLPIEESPVGIDKAKEDLLMLLDEVNGEAAKLRVISIVGFGGSGKTTLANAVYKSPAAVDAERFPLRAWVRRSHYGNTSDLLRKIIKEFWGATVEAQTQNFDEWELQKYLEENSREQRYLVVLVDMDMFYWKWIKAIFKNNDKSSRIIVTTCMVSTAKECSSDDGFVYKMRNLGPEVSEEMALGNQTTAGDSASRKALVDKCDGHPLSLVSVARHISGRITNSPNRHHCAELCNRLGSFLHTPVASEGADHFVDLRGVLINNYNSLSYCTVQPGLLYMCIFTVDGFKLKKKKITKRWVAEGYAPSNDHRESEQEVADRIFENFVDMNFIRPVGVSSSTCKALGIVHEFMADKSIFDNFIMPFNAQERRTDRALGHEEKVRHLFVNDGNVESSGSTFSMDLSRVRSLTVLSKSAGGSFNKFSKYRLMRVLDLENCTEVNRNHLRKICKLWNLRYLSLGDNIKKLPKKIVKLKLLETLTVSKNVVTELPVEVLGMPCLVHLNGKFTLPKKLPKKQKLKKLCEDNKLQTLAGFIANGNNEGFLQLMVDMKNLRKVKIWCQSTGEVRDINSLNSDLVQAMKEYGKSPLQCATTTHVRSISVDFEMFPQGPLPEVGKIHLSSLKLHSNLSTTMPRFVDCLDIAELKYLCLSLNVLTPELLSAIGRMLYLTHLKLIVDMVTEGLVIEIGEFLQLQRLYFVITRPDAVIPLMQVQDGHLPKLESLQLLSEHLAGTSGIEIRHLRNLQDIELHPEVSEQARQEWEAAARNHPNRPNVLPYKSMDNPVNSAAHAEPMENPVTSVAPAGEELVENLVATTAQAGNAPAEVTVASDGPEHHEPGDSQVASTAAPVGCAPADPIENLIAQDMTLLNNQTTENQQTAGEEAPDNSAIPTQPANEVSDDRSHVQTGQQGTSSFSVCEQTVTVYRMVEALRSTSNRSHFAGSSSGHAPNLCNETSS